MGSPWGKGLGKEGSAGFGVGPWVWGATAKNPCDKHAALGSGEGRQQHARGSKLCYGRGSAPPRRPRTFVQVRDEADCTHRGPGRGFVVLAVRAKLQPEPGCPALHSLLPNAPAHQTPHTQSTPRSLVKGLASWTRGA